MKKAVPWIAAFVVTAASVAGVMLMQMNGTQVYEGDMTLRSWVPKLNALLTVMVIAEFVFFGVRDVPKQMMLRFVVHNGLGFVCANAGYLICKTTGLNGDFSIGTVYNVVLPACCQFVFRATLAAAAVCAVIYLIRQVTGRKKRQRT